MSKHIRIRAILYGSTIVLATAVYFWWSLAQGVLPSAGQIEKMSAELIIGADGVTFEIPREAIPDLLA